MKKYMLILAMSLMACGASNGTEVDIDAAEDVDLDVSSDSVTDAFEDVTNDDASTDATEDVTNDVIVDASTDVKDCSADAHICHKHHCHH